MATEFLMVIGLLAALAILSVVVMLLLANLGAYFTKIAEGTTVFISTGDSLKAVLPNIRGYRMSDNQDLENRYWLIPESDKKKVLDSFFRDSMFGTRRLQRFLWKIFGVKFISFFWPQVHVHQFDVRKGGRRRIEGRSEDKSNAPLRSRVVDSPSSSSVVDSLLFVVPRPVYIEGVELPGDNSRINLLLLAIFRQVIPSLPAYELKGDFFTLLDSAIEAAVVDFFSRHRVAVDGDGKFMDNTYTSQQGSVASPLSYFHWLRLSKAGETSPLETYLRSINISKAYLEKLKQSQTKDELVKYVQEHFVQGTLPEAQEGELAKMVPGGIIPRIGFALVSFRIVEWEVHESTKDLADALLAKETESHKAEGVRQEAFGKRDATKAQGEGESSRYEKLMNALVAKGVDANVAAKVVETQVRTENIRSAANLTTYVEGGASASIMIPTSPSQANK